MFLFGNQGLPLTSGIEKLELKYIYAPHHHHHHYSVQYFSLVIGSSVADDTFLTRLGFFFFQFWLIKSHLRVSITEENLTEKPSVNPRVIQVIQLFKSETEFLNNQRQKISF